jgi:hypothetical protein
VPLSMLLSTDSGSRPDLPWLLVCRPRLANYEILIRRLSIVRIDFLYGMQIFNVYALRRLGRPPASLPYHVPDHEKSMGCVPR